MHIATLLLLIDFLYFALMNYSRSIDLIWLTIVSIFFCILELDIAIWSIESFDFLLRFMNPLALDYSLLNHFDNLSPPYH